MIDSGSVITMISPKLVKELGLKITLNTGAHVIRNADDTLNKDGWHEDVEVSLSEDGDALDMSRGRTLRRVIEVV